MSIFKRGETWWIDIVHRGQRVRESAGTKNKAEAQRFHDQRRAELWQEVRSGHTLADAIGIWLKATPRSDREKSALRLFLERYPSRPLSEITGQGIADALAEMVDIGMVSREIHPAEVQKGAWSIPVTKDAVVPVINRGNPLFKEIMKKGIKKADFARIWLNEEAPTWNELMDGKGSAQVHVYTRSDSCGAAETWAAFMGQKQEDLLGIGVFGDPGLNEAVRKDALGIGFNNINYAYDATSLKPMSGTAILPIDLNGNGKIDADESFYEDRDAITKAIANNKYPSPPARDLYFVCKGRPRNPLVKAFMKWLLKEGQKFVPEAGYIALAPDKVAQALARIGQ